MFDECNKIVRCVINPYYRGREIFTADFTAEDNIFYESTRLHFSVYIYIYIFFRVIVKEDEWRIDREKRNGIAQLSINYNSSG